jgi:hypothetical protein
MSEFQTQHCISLKPLYDFVKAHQLHKKPFRGGVSRAYSKECSMLTNGIDAAQGFYLWGHYKFPRRYWLSQYFGKAGFGKTANLKARIREELTDECAFVWRSVHSEKTIFRMSDAINPRYHRACSRAMLKAGATHIFWVPARGLPAADVIRVEADLIEALNPVANILRPTPPDTVQEAATGIFQEFRSVIHASRPTAFKVSAAPEI